MSKANNKSLNRSKAPAQPLVHSVVEIRELFKISESTLWRWAGDGRFGDLVRIGRRTYVSAASINRIVGVS